MIEYKVEGMTRGDAYYIFRNLDGDFTEEEKLEAISKVTRYLTESKRPRNKLVKMLDMLNALKYLLKVLKESEAQ